MDHVEEPAQEPGHPTEAECWWEFWLLWNDITIGPYRDGFSRPTCDEFFSRPTCDEFTVS